MTEHKTKKLKRLIFPVGIFLLMFTAESLIGTAGVVSYFYFSGKKNISDIESYTVNYSKTMAEAFARVAEFSYSTKKYSSLKTLFHEKIEENTIDEAFFVLPDGRLVVHSSTTAEKELMGNIATDEMAYNLDMILLPVETKSSELFLNNYNIINKVVPFKRQDRDLLKKYVYKDLNSTGWIFTKGIFYKGKPAGTVNFIVSKDRIYDSIQESIDQAKYYSLFVVTVSMALSFIIALIILFRYRSIQKNALGSYSHARTFPDAEAAPQLSFRTIDDTTDHEASLFFAPDSNFIEPLMDYVVDDDFDDNIVEEDGTIIPASVLRQESTGGTVIPLRKYEEVSDEDEYITVELLGEIEPEPEDEIYMEIPEAAKEYIAPVISLDKYKNSLNKEIRDAIPIRRKR
jgi:hypothetical protein